MEDKQIVCVVEDNIPINKLFCTLLKKGGFETVSFNNALDAIEYLLENKVSLILLDILLPDMRGNEVLAIVKSKSEVNKDTAFVAVTGFASSSDRDKYMHFGFDDYITKPINTSTFVNQIKPLIK